LPVGQAIKDLTIHQGNWEV